MYLKNTLIVFLSTSFLFLNINSKIKRITIPDNLKKTLFCFAPSTVCLKQIVPEIDKYSEKHKKTIETYKLKFVAEVTYFDKEDNSCFVSFQNNKDIASLLALIKRKVIKQIDWYYMVRVDMYKQYMYLYELNANQQAIPTGYSSEFGPSSSPEIPNERGCFSE